MKSTTKETFVIGFAIFSSVFGAGNLILPPFLGFNAGSEWIWVAVGFIISTAVISLLALLAHARLQGTLLDFGNKVSPLFSLIFSISIYLIAICLPIPRTASVTHEIAVQPFFNSSSLLTSAVYFIIVFVFVINRNNVLSILGKFFTPVIVMILFVLIAIGLYSIPWEAEGSLYVAPVLTGILEGYQTYDAFGGLLVGGVVIISLNSRGYNSFEEKKGIIVRAGLIAFAGLLIIYCGLIAMGAFYHNKFDSDVSRTGLLSGLSLNVLGSVGQVSLSALVALACLATAVSVIVGVADFAKGLFNNSQMAYVATAAIGCTIGIVMGQFNVQFIIDIAIPALTLIYPITIVLIVLNVLPSRYASSIVFRWVVLTTFLFCVPDFLMHFMNSEILETIKGIFPLSDGSLGWVLSAVVAFLATNLFSQMRAKRT